MAEPEPVLIQILKQAKSVRNNNDGTWSVFNKGNNNLGILHDEFHDVESALQQLGYTQSSPYYWDNEKVWSEIERESIERARKRVQEYDNMVSGMQENVSCL